MGEDEYCKVCESAVYRVLSSLRAQVRGCMRERAMGRPDDMHRRPWMFYQLSTLHLRGVARTDLVGRKVERWWSVSMTSMVPEQGGATWQIRGFGAIWAGDCSEQLAATYNSPALRLRLANSPKWRMRTRPWAGA